MKTIDIVLGIACILLQILDSWTTEKSIRRNGMEVESNPAVRSFLQSRSFLKMYLAKILVGIFYASLIIFLSTQGVKDFIAGIAVWYLLRVVLGNASYLLVFYLIRKAGGEVEVQREGSASPSWFASIDGLRDSVAWTLFFVSLGAWIYWQTSNAILIGVAFSNAIKCCNHYRNFHAARMSEQQPAVVSAS